jgi:hypothetical protein
MNAARLAEIEDGAEMTAGEAVVCGAYAAGWLCLAAAFIGAMCGW